MNLANKVGIKIMTANKANNNNKGNRFKSNLRKPKGHGAKRKGSRK
jgi:hypothetical protein